MTLTATFDLTAAHRFFAASCFNQSWPLIDEPARSAEEDEQLIALGHASLWHWTQRSDCSAKNLSIAHWLLSRIYALVGDAAHARRYAESCLRISERGEVAPMFLGYAYEALARAAQLAGDRSAAERFLQVGSELAQKIADEGDRKLLNGDLDAVRAALNAGESSSRLLALAKRYLAALEAGATGDALAAFYTDDVVQEEFPNRLLATGAKRDLAALLDGAVRGQKVMTKQRYEILRTVEDGDTIVLEVNWSGTLAIPFGNLKAGDEMRARFAVFLDYRGDEIARQHNYDCFEPW
jgi:ketosteroid isomerase-like protein